LGGRVKQIKVEENGKVLDFFSVPDICGAEEIKRVVEEAFNLIECEACGYYCCEEDSKEVESEGAWFNYCWACCREKGIGM